VTNDTREWLKALHTSIWTTRAGYRDVGRRREPCTYHEEARRLTVAEWARLEAVLRDEAPIVDFVNSGFGFGCAMRVYDDPVDPVYPGVPQEVPPVLLVVDKNHLPLEGRTEEVSSRGRLKVVPADRTYFEDGWTSFSPYTHDPANVARLVAVGLPAPKSKGHYEY
jgi:hypothetical protein